MNRTAAIAFPFTLFLAWVVYVSSRPGNGPGLQWSRIPDNVSYTVAISGTLYLVFVLIALVVLYFTRIRGEPVSPSVVLLPALLRFAAVYGIALIAAVPLAEWYCYADERAFERETARHYAAAVPDSVTHELPLYSRFRWWPINGELMVSDPPGRR